MQRSVGNDKTALGVASYREQEKYIQIIINNIIQIIPYSPVV